MRYLILLLLPCLFSCSPKLSVEPVKNNSQCDLLIEILKIDKINEFIKKHENTMSIRIIDKAKLFTRTSWCGYSMYSVRIEENYFPDLNTARFIDIIVTSDKTITQDTKEITLLFSPQTMPYEQNHLILGTILFKKESGKWNVESSKFNIVD